ncbi:nucleoside-triphosphatase [Desulfitobacterium sp. PCE1]|uniref:nucleoside-triphosphatase n=1 Tax=Desulfitobacterium sp. PCE1 TaxID=146907 RepID=UPI0003775678|nr:nucleoside-triphosphatase [Desulfitobacterium sp. PCE1]
MHIFLTGEIQVGKSTIIDKTLRICNVAYDGFRTYFGPDRGSPNQRLYMTSASGEQVYQEENVIVRFREEGLPQVLTERFDGYGAELIRLARIKAQLIVMDECGSLERNAFAFQEEILEAIVGSVPILGVIKQASNGWTDQIRYHQNVKLISVNEENRDALPEYIASHLLRYF